MKYGSSFAPAARAKFAAVALLACLAATAATAATAEQNLYKDDWSFNFFNDSSHAVTEFRTTEMSGQFGHNWLITPMDSGHGMTMEFTDPLDGRCDVMTRVVFIDGAVFDRVINYCGTAIVRATEEWLFFE